jgi:predicted metal-dependent hydrolase
MAAIIARIPQVDWSNGFDRHWNGGNAAVTHAFNALSFLFPQAEKFFIGVAREVVSGMDLSNDPDLEKAVRGFIAQESIHSHQHGQYNAVLQQQGFENVAHDFVLRLQLQANKNFSPLTKLAVVCAYEHYTAILGNYILSNPQVLEPAQPEMALIWGWHSAEETEHKAVCFDLYRVAGGGWLRRVTVFLSVTLNFNLMFGRIYFSLLRRDGCMRPSCLFETIGQFLKFFFGRSGIAWHLIGYGIRYLAPGFHPWDQDNRSKLHAWLSANDARLREVGS